MRGLTDSSLSRSLAPPLPPVHSFPLAMMGLKDSSISLINTLIKPSKRGKPPKRSEELQARSRTIDTDGR